MTDRIETEELQAARKTRDTLGSHGDLYMRLMGFYRVGPEGPIEPEFGYRDFSSSELRQPIQKEAAVALATVAAEVLELRAMRDAVSPAVGSMYQSAKASFDEYELIIAHLGDLLGHQIDQTEAWRKAATDSLPIINGLKAELAAARAEIERQKDYIVGRNYEC